MRDLPTRSRTYLGNGFFRNDTAQSADSAIGGPDDGDDEIIMNQAKKKIRVSVVLIFLGVTLGLVTVVSISVWVITNNAGGGSIGRLSVMLRKQILTTAASSIGVIFAEAEHTIRTASASMTQWMGFLNKCRPWTTDEYTDLIRYVVYPVRKTNKMLFSFTLARGVFDVEGFPGQFVSAESISAGLSPTTDWGLAIRSMNHTWMSDLNATLFNETTENNGNPIDFDFDMTPILLSASAMDSTGRVYQVFPAYQSNLHDVMDDPIWENETQISLMFGISTYTAFAVLPYADYVGGLYISASVRTSELSATLATLVTGKQRLFLTLQGSEGRLMAVSHGKWWSHSDAQPVYADWSQMVSNWTWYSPETSTDLVISGVAQRLLNIYHTWDIHDVDVTITVFDEEWLVLSKSLDHLGRRQQLFLIQDAASIFHDVVSANRLSFIVFGCLLLPAGVVVVVVAMVIVLPLRQLQRTMDRIADVEVTGLLQDVSMTSRIKEVHGLQCSFHGMLVSIDSFRKYVPVGVVQRIIQGGKRPRLEVHRTELTLLFMDLCGFTTFSSTLPPENVAKLLNFVFEEFSSCVCQNRGTIDKYIGDCLMAFWGAPDFFEGHQEFACRALCECRNALATTLKQKLLEHGLPEVSIRAGLHSGSVLIGNVGSAERFNYTAIGHNVNIAARLEPANKHYHTIALVSAAVQSAADSEFGFLKLGPLQLTSSSGPLEVYELIGTAEQYSDVVTHWNTAMRWYLAGQFERAETLFTNLVHHSKAAELFIRRCQEFRTMPPPIGWCGLEQPT